MKKTFATVWVLGLAAVICLPGLVLAEDSKGTAPVEDWKGATPAGKMEIGALTGLGLEGGSASFQLLGAASLRVSDDGFIPDINDQVSAEAELGAAFASDTRFLYSVHMRWDFVKDSSLTPFALAGLSGSAGESVVLAPRFGVGAFWTLASGWTLRAEISRDITVAGVAFAF